MAWTAPRTWVVGEIVTAAQMNTHLRDNLDALDRDSENAVVVGTAGGMGERWYWAGVIASSGTSTTTSIAAGLDQLWSVPFHAPYGPRTLDRIAVNVTTLAASGVARLGIYAATSPTDPYPSALIVDAGEFSTATTGIKSQTISTALEPDTLYWATYICGTAAPTILGLDGAHNFHPVLGTSSSLTNAASNTHIRRTQSYGALPSTYPASPPSTFGAPPVPAIGLRFSA